MASLNLAQQERSTLCDLFVEYGPEAPTLCEGWLAADLAAHLVVRERRPDSGPGLVGPPLLLRPFDGPMNTVEFFIHIEDLRRAQKGWEPRAIPAALADALWARVGPGGMAKKVPATIVLTSPGRDDKVAGSGPRLTLRGDPGDLTMFAAGRQAAAKIEIDGDEMLAGQLRAAALGI